MDSRKIFQKAVLELQDECEADNEDVNYVCDRGIDNLAYSRKYPISGRQERVFFFYNGYVGEDFYTELCSSASARNCIRRYKKENSRVFVLHPNEVRPIIQ